MNKYVLSVLLSLAFVGCQNSGGSSTSTPSQTAQAVDSKTKQELIAKNGIYSKWQMSDSSDGIQNNYTFEFGENLLRVTYISSSNGHQCMVTADVPVQFSDNQFRVLQTVSRNETKRFSDGTNLHCDFEIKQSTVVYNISGTTLTLIESVSQQKLQLEYQAETSLKIPVAQQPQRLQQLVQHPQE